MYIYLDLCLQNKIYNRIYFDEYKKMKNWYQLAPYIFYRNKLLGKNVNIQGTMAGKF